MIAFRLASPAGRVGRVVVGLLVALAGMMLLSGWVAFAVVMLDAEIAVGGAINVCVLCPLFGLLFAGRKLESRSAGRPRGAAPSQR
jgi:ABC-type uncharacterized transport system permease subunit